jgi:hypothetical protein
MANESSGNSAMKYRHAAAILFGAISVSASLAVAAPVAPAPAAKTPPPGTVILDFKPLMDDLMTMLIQPRHIKLYYAAQAKNWTLAAFELNELQTAFQRVGQTIPKYLNFSVDATINSIILDKMKAVNGAIKAGNLAEFNSSYGELTDACNTCHQGMNHPFLVVKVPDAMNYPDQDFRPPTLPK